MRRSRAFRMVQPADAGADPHRRADSDSHPDSHRDSYPCQAAPQKGQSQEGPSRGHGREHRIGERGESHS